MKNVTYKILFAVGFLAFVWHNPAAADTKAKDIIKKVKEKYEKVETLKANFKQVFVWELAGETQTVEGVIYIKSGDRYRIETADQMVVTDGQNVWTYSKTDAQVIVDRLQKSEENPLPKDFLFKYSEDYKAQFAGEEKIDGKKTYVLNLLPKNEDDLITSMKIWVDADDWFTTKIEQVDINENVNTYHISSIQVNTPLENSFFSFQIPPETEVVDLREN